MATPKIHLLYFKSIIDVVLLRFFDDFNDHFSKVDGYYAIQKSLGRSKLKRVFKAYINEELDKIVQEFNILEPHYYFLIGACMPKDNFLLKFRDDRFPKRLDHLLANEYQIKYFLKEKDIKIDLVMFNSVILDIFNEMFNQTSKKSSKRNLIFISHHQLDCYSMFKSLKFIFGGSNCINEFEARYHDLKSPIIAVNDLIDKSIHNKSEVNRSKEFKLMIEEIRQFVGERMAVR